MGKNMYMHLINGKPAMYEQGRQIVFVGGFKKLTMDEMFVGDLKTIKRQQEASAEWRKKNGMGNLPGIYSYLSIKA